MKKYYAFRSIMLLGLLAACLGGCGDTCQQTYVYTVYEPVYMTPEEFRASVKTVAPTEVKQPGKIYLKDNYLFVNEVGKGIHIFYNADPSAPRNIAFLNIPGNVDMAVMGSILYADSQTDLLAIDISDPANPQAVKRIADVYPNTGQVYPGPWRPATVMPEINTSRGIIVDWVKKEEKRVSGCDQPTDLPTGWIDRGGIWSFAQFADARSFSAAPASGPTAGVGGSMARFTISRDYLYTVDNSSMRLYDISQPANPVPGNTVQVGWGIETIFPYKDKLFIGSQTGMFIYDASNPAQPQLLSNFQHARACDPVVADDQYAYVTLRDGTACTGTANQLDVVDISDARNPHLVRTYPMQHPHGLGKDGNTLFVCEGKYGLKVYNAADVRAIDNNHLGTQQQHSFDVIPYRNVAIVTGEDGLYQYDYTDPKHLKLLSKIAITKN